METYNNLAELTKKIYDSGIVLFDIQTIRDISGIKKEASFFSVLNRLVNSGILEKIERKKYILKNSSVNDFLLANFAYAPSYVSLESALNFYGILSQFPYEISSITLKKPLNKNIKEKLFSYVHIQRDLFWGYEKKENYLIAMPEKALLDYLYLWSKGLKTLNMDELDFSGLKKSILKKFFKKYSQKKGAKNIRQALVEYSLI